MTTMLFESPFILVAIAAVLSILLIVMYFQTNDVRLRPIIGVTVFLILLPIATDTLVVTEREKIKTTLGRLTRAVRMNDVPATLAFAHPESKNVYKKIQHEMPTYKFSMCNLAGVHSIEFSDDANRAMVKFTVMVNVKAKRGPEGFGNRGITLTMRKDTQEAWKIVDYQHYPTTKRNQKNKLDQF